MASISKTKATKSGKSLTQADVANIKVGDTYIYDGESTLTKGQVYDAEVISITNYLIVLSIRLKHTSQGFAAVAEAIPYNKSILKQDIGSREHLRRC